ncbi:hypothetical protein AB0C33_01940 [Nonomuraea sp. NPDC048881]|uniref:hypothetical protein n=1 Tax=Nonomuraea sp. NPDC048881 TaxID=3155030 RepID=UPI0033CE321D
MATKHYVNITNRRVEVRVLASVYGGIQVEAVRAYPAAGICKGQMFTVSHDLVVKETARRQRDVKRALAHQKRMRALAKAAKEGSESAESASESPSASAGSGQAKCPVCATEHAPGACTMNVVLEGK